MILVLKEDVDDGGHEGIQEGKDGDGDEEFCRGRVVSDERDAVSPDPLARRRLEGHLVQPEGPRQPRTSVKRTCPSVVLHHKTGKRLKSLISLHR